MIEHGYCHCGCGEKTNIVTYADKRKGYEKGQPYKYITGHSGIGKHFKRTRGKDSVELECKDCGNVKAATSFMWLKTRSHYDSRCFDCSNIRSKLLKYGLTQKEYDILMSTTSCEICEKSFEGVSRVIDHDHGTGKVRGLLCNKCNLTLGHAEDDASLLRRAADYIERHKNEL